MSVISNPALFNTLLIENAGPSNNSSLRSAPVKAKSMISALGCKPSSNALDSVIRSTTAPPSVKKEELAAVSVPCFLSNAGLSLLSFSIFEPALIPLSL